MDSYIESINRVLKDMQNLDIQPTRNNVYLLADAMAELEKLAKNLAADLAPEGTEEEETDV